MANIKSAKKRILVSKKREMRNKAVNTAVAEGNKEEAAKALTLATSKISKAASKGILHKNTASRKISRLNLAVNKMN